MVIEQIKMVKEKNNKKKKNKAEASDTIKQQNISKSNRTFTTINQNFVLSDSTSKHIKKNIYYLYLFNFGVILYIVNLIAKRFIKMQNIKF